MFRPTTPRHRLTSVLPLAAQAQRAAAFQERREMLAAPRDPYLRQMRAEAEAREHRMGATRVLRGRP